ncbi:MAG: SUMF1/EgtB/PvdO family nonheme iron enzyme [Rikenellaceae bacterium]|nr:SUMF1/EgtB/PvdO family nonheme iron enzyme [Rikenellaceae bacterium]
MNRTIFSCILFASMMCSTSLFAQGWGQAVIKAKKEVAASLAKANMPVSVEIHKGERAKSVVIDVSGLDKLAIVNSVIDKGVNTDQFVMAEGVLTAVDGTQVSLDRVAREYVEPWQRLSFNKNYYNKPITVGGQVFEQGMLMWPNGELVLKLDKKYKSLTVKIGLDDYKVSQNGALRVNFQNVASRDALKKFVELAPVEVTDFVQLGDVRVPVWLNELSNARVEKRAAERIVERLADGSAFEARIKAIDPEKPESAADYIEIFNQAKRVLFLQSRFKWVNAASIKDAFADMKTIKGFDASAVEPKVKELLALVGSNINIYSGSDEDLAKAERVLELQRQVMLSNPYLKSGNILVGRYKLGETARHAMGHSIGTQANNWSNQMSAARMGFDAEIAELTDVAGDMGVRTVYKPEGGSSVPDLHLHWDADRMMFSKINERGLWGVFEVDLNDGDCREVVKVDDEDLEFFDAAYLPSGKIMAVSNVGYQGVPCVDGEDAVGNLVLYNPADRDLRRITFDQDANWNPVVMNNGKLMYVRWEYTDLAHYFSRMVMHMNPDGTENKALYGSGGFFPNSTFDVQPLPGSASAFVSIVSGHHGIARSGRLMIFDPGKGRKEVQGLVQEIPFRNREVIPIIKDEMVQGVWPQFLKPWPISDKYFLVSAKLQEESLWGIYLVDVFDNVTLIAEFEGEGLNNPILREKRPTPPVIPDRVDLSQDEATVFIQDIYEGEGLPDVPRGEVKKLRVFAYEYAYINSPSNHVAQGIQSGWDIKRLLGEVPVNEDGSVTFKIPANTPISLQPVDSEGRAIQWMRSWLTGMPGETVSCVGCHEDQNKMPVPKATIAQKMKPLKIEAPEGGIRPFTFELEIQPILDRACISCHNGESSLDFTSGRYDEALGFSKSYLSFHPYFRRQGPEADIYVMKPYEYHATTSPMVQMLKKGHHGVELTDKEWRTLYNWIDFNCPYFSTFNNVKDLKGRDQVKRRMELSKKYNNMVVDWQQELDDYADYLKGQDKPEPVMPAQVKGVDKVVKVKGWPFSAEQAVEMQNALGDTRKVIEVAPGVNMVLRKIPAGSFVMGNARYGSDAPEVKVKIDKPFWIGELEVTNEQFCALVPEHDSRFVAQQWKDHVGPGYPANLPDQAVTRVSYDDAAEYCRLLSEKTGLKVTLPTEEQWEWAARAGSSDAVWYGNLNTDFGKYANLADVSLEDMAVSGIDPQPMPKTSFWYKYYNFLPKVETVNDGNMLLEPKGGMYQANPWGLYDMIGNVEEWTRSDYKPYGDKKTPEGQVTKVVRGGSWWDRPKDATSYTRRHFLPWQKIHDAGFRIVVEE